MRLALYRKLCAFALFSVARLYDDGTAILGSVSKSNLEAAWSIVDRVTTVLIIDDHLLVADALAAAFANEVGFTVCGVARTGAEGIELALQLQPDVTLIDFRLPDMNGADVVRRLTSETLSRCVILTGTGQERALLEAIDAGAAGFLTKDQRFDEIVEAIAAVARGEASFEAGLLARVLPDLRRGNDSGRRLTSREHEVLRLLVMGLANSEIGERLFISTNTVRNHVANLMVKLHAKSRGEAVAIASREGLVRVDDQDA